MSRRLTTTEPFICVTCEIEIVGAATVHVGLPFCCAGCVAGGPCTCSYDGRVSAARVRHCLDVEGALNADSTSLFGEPIAARRS